VVYLLAAAIKAVTDKAWQVEKFICRPTKPVSEYSRLHGTVAQCTLHQPVSLIFIVSLVWFTEQEDIKSGWMVGNTVSRWS